jgi:type IV secretory pathway VirJ component
MKPLLSACLLVLALLTVWALPAAAAEETMTLEPFGTVTLYHETARPAHVAIFISGDGGWKLGVVDMARELMGMDALIAGVDIRHYMKAAANQPDHCFDPSGDFAGLGRAIEKKLGYPDHVEPILVGYSSGATLVYAAMVQAKPHTFGGGVSLGFCPDLFVHPPICEGSGLTFKKDPHGQGIDFEPADTQAPWYALQGDIDKICTPEDTRAYLKKVPNGILVWLPKVGHGFSVPKNWIRQLKESFAKATGQEGSQ